MMGHLVAGSLRGLVRQLSIDQFENESRRVSCDSSKMFQPSGSAEGSQQPGGTPMFERAVSDALWVPKLVRASGLLQHLSSGLGAAWH